LDGRHPLQDEDPAEVCTEMCLQVLAYNLRRVIAILGVTPLIAAMRA
jgi:hypothetical protein